MMLASSTQKPLPTVGSSRKASRARSTQVRACLQCTIARRRLVDVPQLGTTAKHASSPLESCISTTSLQKPSNRLGTSPAAVSKEGSGQTDGEDIRQEQSSPATSSSPPSTSGNANTEEEDSLPVRLALQLLQFYRSGISPMMAPSCRYLPTCSEYSIQSYKRFGVWKGTVLTAWRLMRCNPLGSSGYDPPQWPPPGLAFMYGQGSWEYSPQVSVVLGAMAGAWLVNELWQEVAAILWPYQ